MTLRIVTAELLIATSQGPVAARLRTRTRAAHLLCMNFDLVVGSGDDDVFGGEVSHINCELV